MDASQYQQVTQHEHVLLRPGVYIGSIVPEESLQWVLDGDRIVRRRIIYTPGLLKIVGEVLSNAADHVVRLRALAASGQAVRPTRSIKIEFDRAAGRVSVTNDGSGIPCDLNQATGLRTPELVFGHLLTSTNYDDREKRDGIGGVNGIGCKASNIFSRSFDVLTVDDKAGKAYEQAWSNNMREKGPGTLRTHRGYPCTRVSFVPDYERFGCTGIDDDFYALLARHVYDLAAMVGDLGVAVHLDGTRLPVRSFERYVDMYIGDRGSQERFHESLAGGAMEVVVSASPPGAGFQHVSFVNGVHTCRGGRHVEAAADRIAAGVIALVQARKKRTLKPSQIKDNVFLFVRVSIPNPSFDSQTKELLTTPARDFGFRVELSERLLDKLYKSDIVGRALAAQAAVDEKQISKSDGKKRARLSGLPKLEDAELAGTARSAECVLLLTEGDSARSSVIAGLKDVGRQRYGVFPLRGKPLNVLEASAAKLAENQELGAIKKILGLTSNRDYSPDTGNSKELRYGSVWIVSDQDHDGTHIRGLLINLFSALWPSLLRQRGFLRTLQTPIVKARKGSEVLSFYSVRQYKEWASTDPKGYTVKHYKGLGTSSAEEAREWFQVMRTTTYRFEDERDADAIDKAFSKKRADDRKRWLGAFDPEAPALGEGPDLAYRDFIDRELVVFANHDIQRSIPSVVDGLKPSQRKILHACFKRRLTSEVRVAQLAASVSELTCYHHGEASLQGAVVCMAQDFVGSNNASLLVPHGQFGTRIQGGKDAASARYIHTHLDPLAFAAFRAEDTSVLRHEEDDGQVIEPTFFVPVVPMVLVNGALGIGTGFSTSVPCFNPEDVITAVRAAIAGSDVPDLVPWYRGFKGTVERQAAAGEGGPPSYVTRGCFQRSAAAPDTVEVTELPVGVWSEDYKAFLEEQVTKGRLREYASAYTDTEALFQLRFASAEALDKALGDNEAIEAFAKEFRLVSKPLTVSNMHLYAADGRIKRYGSTAEIVADFVAVRAATYTARKDHMLRCLEEEALVAAEKARFVGDVVSGAVALLGVPEDELDRRLEARGYVRRDGESSSNFQHLTRLPIRSLTAEQWRLLGEKAAGLLAQLEALRGTSVAEMWGADLGAFETAWRGHLAEHAARGARTAPQEPRKEPPGRKRRATGGSDAARKHARG